MNIPPLFEVFHLLFLHGLFLMFSFLRSLLIVGWMSAFKRNKFAELQFREDIYYLMIMVRFFLFHILLCLLDNIKVSDGSIG